MSRSAQFQMEKYAMTPTSRLLLAGMAALALSTGGRAIAAPEEIQVYEDDLVKPGGVGLDLHNNYVLSGDSRPDHPGGAAPEHAYRFTPEFYYGVAPNLEVGLYVLSQVEHDGTFTIGGEKLRLKYIAPRASEDKPFYWGANFEIGRVSNRYDVNPWNAELKGIAGYVRGPWKVVGNANLDWTVSGPDRQKPTLNLSAKVGYALAKELSVGFETYNDIGNSHNFGRFGAQEQALYAVVDTAIHGWDLNLGIGRGFTGATDHWVAKAVIGVPFGAK